MKRLFALGMFFIGVVPFIFNVQGSSLSTKKLPEANRQSSNHVSSVANLRVVESQESFLDPDIRLEKRSTRRAQRSYGVNRDMPDTLVYVPVSGSFGGQFIQNPGDAMMMLYQMPADGYITGVNIPVYEWGTGDQELTVSLHKVTYPYRTDGTVYPSSVVDGNGWIGGYDMDASGWMSIAGTTYSPGGTQGICDPGDYVANGAQDPLGDSLGTGQGISMMGLVWPDSTIAVTLDPTNSPIQQDNWLNTTDYGSQPFFQQGEWIGILVAFTGTGGGADPATGFYYGDGTGAVDPWAFTKFYAECGGTSGNGGWHIRHWIVDFELAIMLTGDRAPIFVELPDLPTTISTSDRLISTVVSDDNPSGGASGVAAVTFYFQLDSIGAPLDSVALTLTSGSSDFGTWAGTMPGQSPGTYVYWYLKATDVNVNTTTSTTYVYYIFQPANPYLFLYNATDFPSWISTYYLYDTGLNVDVWSVADYGAPPITLLSTYNMVIEVTGSGPVEILNDSIRTWHTQGAKRYILTGDEWLGAQSGWVDQTYFPGDFQYDVLGIAADFNDVNYYNAGDEWGISRMETIPNNPISGDLYAFLVDSSLYLNYNPYYELGFSNWMDGVTPIAGANTAFRVYEGTVPDISSPDPATPLYDCGIYYDTPYASKSVFLSFDPLSTDADNANGTGYVWVGILAIGPLQQSINWILTDTLPPILSVTPPDTLDFGDVYVGHTLTDSATIENIGGQALEIYSIVSNSPDFVVLNAPTDTLSLFGGEHYTIRVAITPSSLQTYSGTLTITSNDLIIPTYTLEMTATAVNPPAIMVTPDSLFVDLFTGDTAVQILTIDNTTGGSDLVFDITIETTGDSSGSQYFDLGSMPITAVDVDEGNAIVGRELEVRGKRFKGRDTNYLLARRVNNRLADLSGINIGITNASGYMIITTDLQTRGATITNVYFPISGALLDTLDILAIDDDISSASATDINLIRAWVQNGGGLLLQGDGPSSMTNINALLAGSGIEETAYGGYYFGIFTDIYAHPTTVDVDTVYGGSYGSYCSSVTAPAEVVVMDSIGNPHAAASVLSAGKVMAVGNEICSEYNFNIGDTRLFANQIFDWLASRNVVDWLTVVPASGVVSAGSSTNIDVTFNATSMYGGDYYANIVVSSNDPVTPEVAVPAHLHVTGAPDIAVSRDTLDYGTTFVGYSKLDSVVITNGGTDVLVVSNITSNNTDYTVDTTSFTLNPEESQTLRVTFLPVNVGLSTGVLTITSNDPTDSTFTVVLEGEGVLPPVIVVSPDSLYADLFTGDTLTQILTIDNSNGGSDLTFNVSVLEASFSTVVRSEREGYQEVISKTNQQMMGFYADTGRIASNFSLSEGEAAFGRPNRDTGDVLGTFTNFPVENTGIVWVGDDLYVVQWGADAFSRYDVNTQQITDTYYIHTSPYGIAWDGQYLWIGSSNGNIYGYDLAGNLVGSFSCPFIDYPSFTWDGSAFLVNAYWDNDPIFYRLDYTGSIITQYSSTIGGNCSQIVWIAEHTSGEIWGYDNQNMRFIQLSIQSGTVTVVNEFIFGGAYSSYSVTHDGTDLWWSDWNGPLYQIDDGIEEGVSWLYVNPVSGVIPAGTSLDIDVAFDATGMYGGDYYANIVVSSNDPVTPEVAVPAHLHVTGAPDIAVSRDTLDYGTTFVGYGGLDSLVITNGGTDVLIVSSITSNNTDYTLDTTSFTLNPEESQTLRVTFLPVNVGLSTGVLTITSNDPTDSTFTVVLEGEGVLPPVIVVSPDSLYADLFTGDTAVQILTIDNTTGGSDLDWFIGSAGSDGFYDNFDDNVADNWIPTDGNWWVANGYYQVTNTSYMVSTSYYDNDFADYEYEVKMRKTTGGLYNIGLMLNGDPSQLDSYGDWYNCYWLALNTSGDWIFIKEVNGSNITLQPWTYSTDLFTGLGVWNVIKVISANGYFDVYFNNVLQGTYFDSTFTSGKVGLKMYDNGFAGQAEYDYVSLTPVTTGYTFGPVQGGSYRNDVSLNSNERGKITRRGHIVDGEITRDTSREVSQPSSSGDNYVFNRESRDNWLSFLPGSGTVPAGTSMDISVTFNATGMFGGDYNDDIIIASNDPATPEVVVPAYLHVTGVPDIALGGGEYDSTSTINWYTSDATTTHEFSTPYPPNGDGTLTVTIDGDYNSSSEYAEVYIEGNILATINPAVNGPTTVSYTLNMVDLAGYVSDGLVTVEVDNSPYVDPGYGADLHTVQLTYSMGAGDSLQFGSVYLGYSKNMVLGVANVGTDTLIISNIAIDEPAFSADMTSFTLLPQTSQPVVVTFTPAAETQYTGALTITSNDPDEPVMTVALNGEGVSAPQIAVSPDSILEIVPLGGLSTRTLTVNNNGGSDLTFSILVEEGSDQFLERNLLKHVRPAKRNRQMTLKPSGTSRREWKSEIRPMSSKPISRDVWEIPKIEIGKGEEDTRIYPRFERDAGGPDAFGYQWKDSNEPGGPTFDWIDASSGTDIYLSDDDFITGIPLAFTFVYYDSSFTSIGVGSNGWLSFNSNNGWYPSNVPYIDGYYGAIAPMARDLYPPSANYIRYLTTGTAPNRVFVVEYNSIPNFSGGNNKTFEVLFYEGSNKIRFQYLFAPDSPNGFGIESPDETMGLGNAGIDSTFISPTIVTDNYAIEFGVTFLDWLTLSTEIGTIPAGSSMDIDITLDGSIVEEGEYNALLVVSSNDPATPVVNVPVQMTVMEIQYPPTAFDLLTPANGELLTITQDNLSQVTQFSWGASVDPNGTPVLYALQGQGGIAPFSYQGLTNNYFYLSHMAIRDTLQNHGINMANGTWITIATSAGDTTLATNGPFVLTIDASAILAIDGSTLIPDEYALHPNYPNPFNPNTTIRYDLPERAQVSLVIYDLLGRQVRTLVARFEEAGYRSVIWDGTNEQGQQVGAGVYLCRITAGDYVKTNKMILLK